MLTCIACSNSKQLNSSGSLRQPPPEDEDDNAVTPSTKQAIKSLTSQIKDMAVKASGAYKNCKPCSGSSGPKRSRAYVDSDTGSVSGRFYGLYRRPASLNSTPRLRGKELEAKLKALSSGSATPASVSGRTESLFMEEDEAKEWVAQVEPGVLITFVSLPQGGNDLKRIRFSREIFDKWQAQQWWGENYDKVMELYNVKRFSNHEAPLSTPARSIDENSKLESAEDSPVTPQLNKEHLPRHFSRTAGVGYSSSESLENHPMKPGSYQESAGPYSTPKLSSISAAKTETSSIDASARSSSSREIDHSGELSVSNASDLETEWVEQDEPGVYITVRALPGGARELRRVRFSREKFGETQARVWWEANRARIQQQYL
ncbi:protein Brevis radix-like 2 [Salvia splendens]|uniref:protein Brevis radix-like 2 n=1 Tax=Salvia splendens TaxID=180675 RepID=UPI001104ABE8|nr:protein Brevis radix-like 2 [Salvia splendens]XP_042054465.1 protein Brevis radix-like 2 [Salvia splendens]